MAAQTRGPLALRLNDPRCDSYSLPNLTVFIMQSHTPENIDDDQVRLPDLPAWTMPGLLGGGVGLLSLGLALGWSNRTVLSASYLVSFCFFLSISLGALFFVALQHTVHAGWSVTTRRLAEILAANTVLMLVLFLPILLPVLGGTSVLYEWTDAQAVAESELLQHKAPYLNGPFFGFRALLYFAVWITAARFFLNRSTQQDASGDPEITRRMEKAAPPILVLFGLTITFAAFDWMMSIDPEWFSTIYGLYYFSGAAVGCFAVLILVALGLQRAGRLTQAISVEHYHDLGKLLLGFVFFWGYMAFSQYMLIWYANIPEESVWYLARQSGQWGWFSLGLLFGHLLIPFVGLLSREVKRRTCLLGAWAAWILLFHWIDMYWLVVPTFSHNEVPLGLMDVCLAVGMGLLFVAGLLNTARGRALVPVKDPRLDESLAFENV